MLNVNHSVHSGYCITFLRHLNPAWMYTGSVGRELLFNKKQLPGVGMDLRCTNYTGVNT